jgi:hypothetical protein
MIMKALTCKHKNPQYAYLAPERAQAKKIAWQYIKEYTQFIPGAKYNEAELKAQFPVSNGSMATIYLDGADNPDRLRGMYFDGVVLDEVAQMPMTVWTEVIRPALSDRTGWAIFIGTPKGKNHFYKLFQQASKQMTDDGIALPNWEGHMFKASETGILPPEELDDLLRTSGEEAYMQEYECSFDATFRGAYYGKSLVKLEKEGGIRELSYNPGYPVYTGWDLGTDDSTAIWFAQNIDGNIHIIDYYEAKGIEDLTHYINIVLGKPYVYAKHFLPHDVQQRFLGMTQTRFQQIVNAGLKAEVVPKIAVIDGINAVRRILSSCKFDKVKCERGLDCLFSYHAEIDETTGVQDQKPVHDWSSHAADAFRYLSIGIRKTMETAPALSNRSKWNMQNFMVDDYDPLQ